MVARRIPSKPLNSKKQHLEFIHLAKQFVNIRYNCHNSNQKTDPFFDQSKFKSRNAHFKYIWDHYITHVVDKNFHLIGYNVNPQIIQIIKHELLHSDHLIDKLLINVMYICLNIGFMHINNSKLYTTIDKLKLNLNNLKQEYTSLYTLHHGPDTLSTAKINMDINLKKNNVLKMFANLNITLALYYYYYGHDTDDAHAIDQRKYDIIEQFLKSNINTIIKDVKYDYNFIKCEFIKSIENDEPFETMAILYNGTTGHVNTN